MQCEIRDCVQPAIYHLAWITSRHCDREQHLCETHAEPILTGLSFPRGEAEKSIAKDGARGFDVALIIISETHDQQVVYLRELGCNRVIPLLIGIFEATALDRNVKGVRAPRPLTHDAMIELIRTLDGEIESAVIADLKDQVYYTNLNIRRFNQIVSVDMRPSDALNLVVLANKPLFIAEHVLSNVGI